MSRSGKDIIDHPPAGMTMSVRWRPAWLTAVDRQTTTFSELRI
jgi:hypothetical protein